MKIAASSSQKAAKAARSLSAGDSPRTLPTTASPTRAPREQALMAEATATEQAVAFAVDPLQGFAGVQVAGVLVGWEAV